jgi:predicted Na+-dependent transporter
MDAANCFRAYHVERWLVAALRDFSYLHRQPGLLLAGLMAKMILLPVLGWLLLQLTDLPVALQLGTLLLLITRRGNDF